MQKLFLSIWSTKEWNSQMKTYSHIGTEHNLAPVYIKFYSAVITESKRRGSNQHYHLRNGPDFRTAG